MQGLILAVVAYSIWGCFPLFFNYLSNVLPLEVLSHRIIWSLVATLFIGILLGRGKALVQALQNKKVLSLLTLSAILIAINWLVYIYAVVEHRVVESSLGYFITPIVSLVLARLFFKEQLHTLQAWAGILALIAVIWEVVSLGQLPWISLVLAFAFALYGVVRKYCTVDSITGLSIETLLLLPATGAWIAWQLHYNPTQLHFGNSQLYTLLLIGSGFLTALPLILFAMAARKIELSIVGFIMYINPIMQFSIAIFVFDEGYPAQRVVTFALIGCALILFLLGMWKLAKNTSRESAL